MLTNRMFIKDDPERISESQEDFRALMEALKDYMIFAMID